MIFALVSLLLWAGLSIISYVALHRRGGGIPVDDQRDINPHHFGTVVRWLLEPTLDPDWGREYFDKWRYGKVLMRRKEEIVAVYHGDLEFGAPPRKCAALVVAGKLTIAPGRKLDFDIWALGDARIGEGAQLRSLVSEGSLHVEDGVRVDRWLDAAQTLTMGKGVTVVAVVTAGEEIILGEGFRGGKILAPTIRAGDAASRLGRNWQERLPAITYWTSVRQTQHGGPTESGPLTPGQWIQEESVYAGGDYWIGPRSKVLQDISARGSIAIGPDSIIVGSIHAGGSLLVGARTLIAGNISSADLRLEDEVIVTGSVHAMGDVSLGKDTIIGMADQNGGLTATGSVQLTGQAFVAGNISAGDLVAMYKAD